MYSPSPSISASVLMNLVLMPSMAASRMNSPRKPSGMMIIPRPPLCERLMRLEDGVDFGVVDVEAATLRKAHLRPQEGKIFLAHGLTGDGWDCRIVLHRGFLQGFAVLGRQLDRK